MQKSLLPVIAGLTALFLGCVIAHFSDMLVHGRQYDDAYITYRYAVNLAEGRGFVFNTYERVNSASSFLYTVLLAGWLGPRGGVCLAPDVLIPSTPQPHRDMPGAGG